MKKIISVGMAWLMLIILIPFGIGTVNVNAAAQYTVAITSNDQTVDVFCNVPAKYIPGVGNSNTGSYSCAGYVKSFYSSVFGVSVSNLMTGRTPAASSGSFSVTTSPRIGDIGYQTNSSGSGHWFILKEINGDGSYTIIEQNWKKKVDGVTYCSVNRNVSYSATANLKFFRWSNGWALDGATSDTPSTPAAPETPTYPQVQNHNPMGVLDSVEVYENMIVIKGWAFDYDNTNANIDVHAYIDDGLGGKIGIGSATANKGRPDVNAAYPGVGECHGFEAAFGSPSKGTFNVYVYALNNVGEGTDQLIGQEQVTVEVVKPPAKLLGCCENITVQGNMLRISGWSFDGRDLSNPVVIHVYIDSASGSGSTMIAGFGAADSRGDVLNAYGVEYCGFNYLCDATRTGTFNVYVYAIGYNGEVQQIHTQSITVTQNATTPTTVNMAANKSVFSPGEEIKFDFSANNYPTKFNLYIDDKDSGSNVLTKEITTITDGNKGQYKIATLNPGRYSAYVVASNRAGSLKSNVITLKVSEPFTPVATLTDNGYTYVLYDDLLTWTEAKNKCEELGGHLVTITSEHEQSVVGSLLNNATNKYYWIGLSDAKTEGSYQWVTGETYNFTNWCDGQPDNWNDEEDYIIMLRDGGGWNDTREHSFGFILEKELAYTITYNANGGKTAPSAQTKTHGKNLTLSSTEPTRDNYTFLGWSENKNATTATYTSGAVFSEDKDATLYAIWQKNASTHTPGDINGDGLVNNKDLTRLMKYIAGENVEVVEAALDVNGDGTVNNKDLTRLMKYLAGADVTIN